MRTVGSDGNLNQPIKTRGVPRVGRAVHRGGRHTENRNPSSQSQAPSCLFLRLQQYPIHRMPAALDPLIARNRLHPPHDSRISCPGIPTQPLHVLHACPARDPRPHRTEMDLTRQLQKIRIVLAKHSQTFQKSSQFALLRSISAPWIPWPRIPRNAGQHPGDTQSRFVWLSIKTLDLSFTHFSYVSSFLGGWATRGSAGGGSRIVW